MSTRRFFIISFLFCLTVSLSGAQTLLMPLNQVKPGMKGKGKSVFQGSVVEEFDVEILGILEHNQPKRNIILANLSGKDLETTGVLSGMSGSPVYIDGKLIGAVAFSFPYAKKPIAGITPIGEMMSVAAPKEKAKTSFSLQMPFKLSLTLEEYFERNKDVFASRASAEFGGQTYVPLAMPILFKGFSPRLFDKVRPIFQKWGFTPVLAGGSGQSLEKLASDLTLREGDPVAIQLIGGDMDFSALGTVTYVDGNRVLAFGHPFYNLGPVDFAMTKASIVTVVPTLDNSFKVGATGPLIGKFTQDRPSGAFGEIGKMPSLIPVNIRKVEPEGGGNEFKLKVIRDKIMTPLLMNLAVSSVLQNEERSYGDLTLELNGDVFLDNGLSVHLEDMFSGAMGDTVTNVSGLIMAVVYYLTNNEFRDIGIHRIDVNVMSKEEARFSYLERVWLDKYEASPGEIIQIKVITRTFRGETAEQEVPLVVPSLPSGSEFTLVVGDAASMAQLEMSQYRSQDFVPRSLNQLIRLLNNLRKNNRIYFKIIASKPGLFLKGEEMPNLPPSMKSMFASPRAATSMPTEITRSTLSEYQLPAAYVFKGLAAIPIKIKK
jgi:hypothetical protein